MIKTLLFLLLPFILAAQNITYPDTVVLKSGRIYPCYVTQLNENKIQIEYGKRSARSVSGIANVKRIILGDKGLVFREDTGFLLDTKALADWVDDREKKRQERLARLSRPQKTEAASQQEILPQRSAKSLFPNRWSFGVLYVPYYSGKTHYLQWFREYNIYVFSVSESRTLFEGQLAFLLLPRLRITFDIGYTSTYDRNREERHIRNSDYNSKDDKGLLVMNDLSILTFSVGAKYYLHPLKEQKVSAYFTAGFGKQLAFCSIKQEELFIDENEPHLETDHNIEEFTEDLNSPWLFNAGFGTEYAFNCSLTLFANIRFYYTTVSAAYDYRTVYGPQTTSGSKEIEKSNVSTLIGLGLNFYF